MSAPTAVSGRRFRGKAPGELGEEALSPESRKRFDDHLKGCPFCRIYLEQMRQTIGALAQLPDEAISSKALDTLREHFRRWR